MLLNIDNTESTKSSCVLHILGFGLGSRSWDPRHRTNLSNEIKIEVS